MSEWTSESVQADLNARSSGARPNRPCTEGEPLTSANVDAAVVSPGTQERRSGSALGPQIGSSCYGTPEADVSAQDTAPPQGLSEAHTDTQDAVDLESALRELELEYEATERAAQHDEDVKDQPLLHASDALHERLHGLTPGQGSSGDAPRPEANATATVLASSEPAHSPKPESPDPLSLDAPLLGSPQDPHSANSKQGASWKLPHVQEHGEEPLLSDSLYPQTLPALMHDAEDVISENRVAQGGGSHGCPHGSMDSDPQQADEEEVQKEDSGTARTLFGGLETEGPEEDESCKETKPRDSDDSPEAQRCTAGEEGQVTLTLPECAPSSAPGVGVSSSSRSMQSSADLPVSHPVCSSSVSFQHPPHCSIL
jgi:hypothetical protein